ncbi:MAG: hypothetical protein IJT44_04025 [Clostridia bacterium]|nr:hypothetical protein [Clostridia bacterium]
MKYIDFLDKAVERKAQYEEIGVNQTFGQAYFSALRNGNETVDFNYVIWDSDVDPILADCRRFGVTEFTVSSTFSSLVQIIAAFVDRGCRLDGMTKVKGTYDAPGTDERILIPAFLLRVGQEGDHA